MGSQKSKRIAEIYRRHLIEEGRLHPSRSTRTIRLASVVAVVVGVANIIYQLKEEGHLKRADPNLAQLEQEISAAQQNLNEGLGKARTFADELIATAKQQEQELVRLRARHEELKALVSGQEELARTYRAILTDRPWTERLLDGVYGFALGIASSIASSWFWEAVVRKKLLGAAEDGGDATS